MADRASLVTTLVSNILICCLLAVPALGETALLANPSARSSLSLNGTWRVIPDPYETGLRGRYFLNRKPASKSALVEYDFDSAWPLKVPGDWNSQREDLLFYEGPVWYERSFLYHKDPDSHVFLYFGAANYAVRVYLNGKELGEHEGGFTPFNFEASNALADGTNFVVVEVNDTRRPDGVPSLDIDWWNYGGLTRDVALVEVPQEFIENYSLHLAKGSLNDLEGWVQVRGATAGERVNLDMPEARIQQTATTNSAGRALFHFPAKLELWSPEHPRLYQVVFHAGKDSVTDAIGFRSVEIRGAQILLNGKPVFLRGVNMHEQAPFRDGRAFSEEDERILLGWAKQLGCNFVRLAHYPHNEHAIRLADKIGLLVWEEIPVYWGNAWDNPATLENAEAQMRDVVARDRNRAAVILWSLSNETPVSPARVNFLTELASFTRAQDDTRLLTSAMLSRAQFAAHSENPGERSVESIIFDDPLGEVLDVLGINEYVGWYTGKPEDADHLEWKIKWTKPVIISEFGAGALAGFHADAETRFSEEYQSSVYQHQLGMMRRVPGLAGMTPWVLMDFRSPRRALAGVQDYHNRKGLISDRGEKKQAFYLLQKFYRDLGAGTPAQQK